MSEILRSYRRNAVHVRDALALPEDGAGPLEVTSGYLRDAGRVERYKRLSIPVRRALNPTDRASFVHALAALDECGRARDEHVHRAREAWAALQKELEAVVGFGGEKVARGEMLAAWLKAAAFHSALDREGAYDEFMQRWGQAAEGAGAQFTEDAARIVLMLDEAAAAELGEPVILPPPPRTPPPPPDPNDRWWRRWRLHSSRPTDSEQ